MHPQDFTNYSQIIAYFDEMLPLAMASYNIYTMSGLINSTAALGSAATGATGGAGASTGAATGAATGGASTGAAAGTGCAVGTAGATGACASCVAGTYANQTGLAQCYSCPAGSYSTAAGASTCTMCAAGTYNGATGATTCTASPANSWSAAGATAATQCGAHATSPASSTSAAACVCDANYIGGGTGPCILATCANAGNATNCASLSGCAAVGGWSCATGTWVDYAGCVAASDMSAAATNPVASCAIRNSTGSSGVRWWFPTASNPAGFGPVALSGTVQSCCNAEVQLTSSAAAPASVGPNVNGTGCHFVSAGACTVLAFRGTPPTSADTAIAFKALLIAQVAAGAAAGLPSSSVSQLAGLVTSSGPYVNGQSGTYMMVVQIGAPPAGVSYTATNIVASISTHISNINSAATSASSAVGISVPFQILSDVAFVAYGGASDTTGTGHNVNAGGLSSVGSALPILIFSAALAALIGKKLISR